ncbi:MAG: tyrosine-protein kinase domain-containing protein [Bacteroidia bacterium]
MNEVLAALRKYWYYIAATLIVFLSLAFYKLKTSPKVYGVKARMLLDNPQAGSQGSAELMKELAMLRINSDMQDRIGLLSSNSHIERTLRRMPNSGILFSREEWSKTQIPAERFPFAVEVDSSHSQLIYFHFFVSPESEGFVKLTGKAKTAYLYDIDQDYVSEEIPDFEIEETVKIGEYVRNPYFRFRLVRNEEIPFTEESKYSFQFASVYDLVDQYAGNLSVNAVSDESNIVELYTVGILVNKEKEFLDLLMDVYMEQEYRIQAEFGERTMAFIDRQIQSTADSLRNAESMMQSFRSRSNIISVESTSESLASQLLELEKARFTQVDQIRALESILRALNSSSGTIPSVQGIPDPVLSDVLSELAKLLQQKAALQLTSTAASPELMSLQRRIDIARESARDNVENLLNSGQATLVELEERIDKIRGRMSQLPRSERELVQIERQFNFIDQMYKYLQEKRAETGIALASNTTRSMVVDPARLASKKPVAPNSMMLFGLALVMGLALPSGVIIGLQFVNTRIIRKEDIARYTDAPVLGMIVKNDQDFNVLKPAYSNTPLAESFRSVLVHLHTHKAGRHVQIIGLTSHRSQEGKSFCTANLASVLAQKGRRTVLIDLDLRHPRMPQYYPCDESRSVLAYLQGYAQIEQIIQPTDVPNLEVIPAGPPFHNPLDLLDSELFHQLLAKLRERYDYILLDTPPIGITSDYHLLKKQVDYTIFVVRHNFTTFKSLEMLGDLRADGNFGPIGIMINMVKETASYNYGYKTHYY